ncbi:unnamed protein product [Brassica oleracea var. botrytis]|uniref:Uncharacterized protein n=1 Tax=Brassica oleracea TaxID=3712 RepID=A0A3P6EDT2_BRAOL|nr:unnamed protein product [Brassica oleracea]
MSLSKKYILIAFAFTIFFAMSIVRCTDIVSGTTLKFIKYNMCYGPCDDKGVCEPYCHTKKGPIRGDFAGKRKGYLGLCCCDEH